jgi:hypothetical protein
MDRTKEGRKEPPVGIEGREGVTDGCRVKVGVEGRKEGRLVPKEEREVGIDGSK